MEDENAINKKFQKEMTAGVSSLLLLNILSKLKEPMYGYRIAKLLEANEDEKPAVKQGALYPVLRSLEKSGLLTSLNHNFSRGLQAIELEHIKGRVGVPVCLLT